VFQTFDRYVLREVGQSWLGVTGVLLAILLANQLARILGQAAAAGFPAEIVLSLVGFTAITNLTLLLPIGLLLAIVLALGRLYHESEMAAARACGVGPQRLYRPVFLLALVVAAALAWLALVAAPQSSAQAQELRRTAFRDAQFGKLEAGRFRTFSGGRAVFYAESVDADGTLRNVFVQRQSGERLEVATAERAVHRIEDDGALHIITLYEGVRYDGEPGTTEFRRIRFAEHGIPVRLPAAEAGKGRREAVPTATLLASSDPADIAEWQWRVSLPLMVLVLALIGVPLAALRPRQGRYARVGLAIVAYFVYANVIGAAQVWVEKGQVPAAIGLWWVHAVALAIGLWLLHRQSPLSLLFRRGEP